MQETPEKQASSGLVEHLEAEVLRRNVSRVLEDLDKNRFQNSPPARLVAVTKTVGPDVINQLKALNILDIGENRAQVALPKLPKIAPEFRLHWIGRLQTNKVKYIAPYITLIEAVDSYKLLAEINKQAGKHGRIIPCLLEIHVAQEESKYGFTPESCREMLASGEWKNLNNVRIAGVMGMATNTDDETQIEQEFRTLKALFDEWKQIFFANEPSFKEISMGMSHDYRIAVRAGSTLVRVGSKIFGERNYIK